MALAQENVIAFPSAPKQRETKHPGLTKRGNVWWMTFIDGTGRRQRVSTGTESITEARTILEDAKVGVRTGKLVFENQKPRKVLFNDFVWEGIRVKSASIKGGYTLEEARILLEGDNAQRSQLQKVLDAEKASGIRPRFKFKSVYAYFFRLRIILEFFKNSEVAQITPDGVRRYIEKRKQTVSPASINRETTTLNDIIKWALESDKYRSLGYRSPVSSRSHKQVEGDPQKRYWTHEERAAFLKAVDDLGEDLFFPGNLFKDLARWQWLTGMRIEETLDTRVSDFKPSLGKQGQVHLASWQNKSGRPVVIRLQSKEAREIALYNMEGKAPDSYLFTWKGCHKRQKTGDKVEYFSVCKAFKKVVQKAGIKGGNIHSWRKTYAMDRAIDGADLLDIKTELRHKDLVTTQRYLDMETVKEMREMKETSK